MKIRTLSARTALLLLALGAPTSAAADTEGTSKTEATQKLEAKSLELRRELVQVTPRVFTAVGFSPGNVSVIVGKTGLVVVDTGMSPSHAKEVLDAFRTISSLPVEAIIYTHGHGDHTGGASAFAEGAKPQVWARSGLNAEGRAFASAGLTINQLRGARQGGFRLPDEKRINNGVALPFRPDHADPFGGEASGFVEPTHTFDEQRREIQVAGIEIHLVAAPGETSDGLYLWFPADRVVFTGDNFYRSWPNLYPIRGAPYRDVQAWAASIDRMLAENPEHVVPGHTRPLLGRDAAREALTAYRDAIHYVFDETIKGMNAGLSPDQLAHEIQVPAELRKHDFLAAYYGHPAWGVRSIFSGYLGWFDGNATNLFPLSPAGEARRIAQLVGGPDALRQAARQALAAGDAQWAAQLADHLLALDEASAAAMEIKADAFEVLAENLLTATGRNYYLTQADELRRAAKSQAGAVGTIHVDSAAPPQGRP